MAKGLSLRALAREVDCSPSLISKIEGQKANPSINMLHRVCAALGINMAELFSEVGEASVVGRAGKRPIVRSGTPENGRSFDMERLVPPGPGVLLQGVIHSIEPGNGSDPDLRHEGEEFGYVLEGELSLEVDGVDYLLGPGDSFFFRSNLAHRFANNGSVLCRVIWVNTPPSF